MDSPMTIGFLLGLVLGSWGGYKVGYVSAIRRSGCDDIRTSLRRLLEGRW